MIELRPSVRPYALPDEVVTQSWTKRAERNLSHLDRYKRREKARAELNGGMLRVPNLTNIESRSQIGERIALTVETATDVNNLLMRRARGAKFQVDPCDGCKFVKEASCAAELGVTLIDNQPICAERRKPVRFIGTRGVIPINLR